MTYSARKKLGSSVSRQTRRAFSISQIALLIPIAWISERVNGGSLRAAEWARAKIDELSR